MGSPLLAFGVPVMGWVPVDVAGVAPSAPRESRFEVLQSDGTWHEAEALFDSEPGPAPEERHRRPSWVIDYDRAPFLGLCRGEAIEAAEAVRRAHARIERESLAIGLVVASVAAELREGDCTEYAFLAAALLRCHGWPTRLAFGLAVVELRGAWRAAYHAWAEYFHDGRWYVADATGIQQAAQVSYLRQRIVEDESPSIDRELRPLLTRSFVSRVRVSSRAPTPARRP